MNEETLKQLHLLHKEVEYLNKQINSIFPKIVTDKVMGSSKEFPYTLQNITITGIDEGEYNKKLRKYQRKLKVRLDEVMLLVEELNDYIEKQEDSEIRQIMALKYINNLTWYQVAEHLGYADESAPRKKINRFLKMTDNSEI